MAAMERQRIEAPSNVQFWLDSWGPELVRQVRQGFAAGIEAQPDLGVWVSAERAVPGTHVVIGTDCSGCEAPVWALRKMAVAHTHVFSSDCARAPQEMIAANHGRGSRHKIYHDMVSRFHGELPPITHYVAGFPCKPFSMLRAHSTKLMKEETAKPFFAVLDTLKAVQPQVAVLENVSGVKRVLPLVRRLIQKLGMYEMFTFDLNPASMGEPVHRPRVYMILLRKDCIRFSGQKAAVQTLFEYMQEPCMSRRVASLAERLLPNNHTEVRRVAAQWKETYEKAKADRFAGHAGSTGSRWRSQHAAFKKGRGAVTVKVSADDMLLHLPREREMWAIMAASVPEGDGGRKLIVDLSQSIDRCGMRLDGAGGTESHTRLVFNSVSAGVWPASSDH